MRGLGNTLHMKCELIDIAHSCNLLDGGPALTKKVVILGDLGTLFI